MRAPTYAQWERSVFTRCEALQKDRVAMHVDLEHATRNEWLRHHHITASGTNLALTERTVLTVMRAEVSPPARRVRRRRRSVYALGGESTARVPREAPALDTAAA